MGALRTNLSVICHQIRSPDNLGAVSRVLANFGFPRLILSDPLTYSFREAEKMGVGAGKVLEGMQLATGLPQALSELVYAVGSTSRAELKRRAAISPEEAARRLAGRAAMGKVGLVLGGEKRGLSDEELSLCQDVVVIPTGEEQPSMNVAQAAAVLLYLCAREDAPMPEPRPEEGASLEMVLTLERELGRLLLTAAFLNPQAPGHALGELTRTLTRGSLTRREAEMWLSAIRHLARKLGSA